MTSDPSAGPSKPGMRMDDDGIWVDTRSGAPVTPDDAAWVVELWFGWSQPIPPAVRRQIGLDDGDGSGDRVPLLPSKTPPTLRADREDASG